jgi:outer membrane protein insertion porin family/translocation and assembly module TamA
VFVCDPVQAAVLQGFNWLAPVEVAYSQDRRDQVLNPRRGYFWVASAGHASALTGSDFRYNRAGGEIAGYAMRAPFVFASHIRLGWLDEREFRGLGGTGATVDVVPPQVKLFAGGANSVRGFAQNRVGPRVLTVPVESLVGDRGTVGPVCIPDAIADRSCDAGDLRDAAFEVRPTGGNFLLEASIETRFPLSGPQLEGAVFLDVGQVWDDPGHVSLSEFEFSPGIGVRYLTPIGPVRIDIGYRFRREEALRVVTSGVRPFDATTDAPGDRLTGPGGNPLEWVRTDDLALLDPRVLYGETNLWSFGRLQLHFSIGQAY